MSIAADVDRLGHAGPRAGLGERPIRVFYLIDRLVVGGTETQLVATIRHLDRGRVRPYLGLLYPEDGRSRPLEPPDCPVLRLGVRRLLAPGTAGKVRGLARFLRRERIDVLQAYFPDSTYFGALAGRLAGVPCVVRTRNNVNHWMTPTHRALGRLLNRFVAATLCNSEAGRLAVLADERPDPGSVVVIENGVDLDRFASIPPPPAVPGGPRRVGLVANLRPVKGVDVFVRAAARVAEAHPDATFHVAGEGPQRPELERLAGELGLGGRLALPGRVDDVPGFLAGLDVAVLSSRAEGTPNALLEYMAAGRPVAAAAVGGVADLVEDGVHGLLVPPDDPARLAAAVSRLLGDPGLAAGLGAAARRRARERFGREAATRRVEDFYLGLIGGHGHAGRVGGR